MTLVGRAEKVSSYFGYWPEFCDAKVENFSYISSGIIELGIFYIDASLGKRAHITLRFTGVTEIALSDLLSENVVDEISIEGDGQLKVTIEACYGMCGSFKCNSVQVSDFNAQLR